MTKLQNVKVYLKLLKKILIIIFVPVEMIKKVVESSSFYWVKKESKIYIRTSNFSFKNISTLK